MKSFRNGEMMIACKTTIDTLRFTDHFIFGELGFFQDVLFFCMWMMVDELLPSMLQSHCLGRFEVKASEICGVLG